MDEKPKSIWKKPWTGWRPSLFGILIVSIAAFLFAVLLAIFTSVKTTLFDKHSGLENFVGYGLVVWFCFLIAAAFVLVFYRIVRWFFCWRIFKRFLFGLACFATLIALFYAEEDWRGQHDWEKFQRAWAAKGEKFDWQSIVPPPVPDDQNFAFSPVWIADNKFNFRTEIERAKAWYGDRIYSQKVSNISSRFPVSTSTIVGTNMWNFPSPPDNSSTWASSRFLDLKPFQSYYRNLGKTNLEAHIIIAPQPQTPAQDVLLALSKFDLVIEQLRQDSARPDSRFPIQYNTGMPTAILLPHLAEEKRFAEVLQLRAIAELQNGENEKALDDVKLMLRLTDASRTEPFLICHLVRISILNLTLQPIWEGLAEHKWSDTELADLDLELAKPDFLAAYEAAIRGERNLEIANIEFLRHPTQEPQFKHPRLFFLARMFSLMRMLSNLSSGTGDDMPVFQTLALGIGPSGWLDQNELRIARFDTKWYLPIVDEETKTVSSSKVRAASNALQPEIQHQTPENILAALFIPRLDGAAIKFAHAQSSTDLARTAIALERYRLAHGKYPESLDALAPQFIAKVPNDVIGGQPLKYRREQNGQFVLYSIGWNERDDGGVVGETKGRFAGFEFGDWVWKYLAK